jgi:hypothetical protein
MLNKKSLDAGSTCGAPVTVSITPHLLSMPSALTGEPSVSRPTLIVVHAHGAVTLVVGHSSTVGTVHRYLEIVRSQAMAVSVRIGEEAALQQQAQLTLSGDSYT